MRRSDQAQRLKVRRARFEDASAIYEWRNDEQTRQASEHQDPIIWERHMDWFKAVLSDSERHLLIAEIDHEPAGVLRFDLQEGARWEVSINLSPSIRGGGWGAPLLRQAAGWLLETEGQASLVAKVRTDNGPSRRAFEKAGYLVLSADHEWTIYERRV